MSPPTNFSLWFVFNLFFRSFIFFFSQAIRHLSFLLPIFNFSEVFQVKLVYGLIFSFFTYQISVKLQGKI